ncbi:MAG: hypothetical protein HYU64_09040 [Armatimonadetes bacterium]|nr:hypothetical protein [Armatimonadota bacterium]
MPTSTPGPTSTPSPTGNPTIEAVEQIRQDHPPVNGSYTTTNAQGQTVWANDGTPVSSSDYQTMVAASQMVKPGENEPVLATRIPTPDPTIQEKWANEADRIRQLDQMNLRYTNEFDKDIKAVRENMMSQYDAARNGLNDARAAADREAEMYGRFTEEYGSYLTPEQLRNADATRDNSAAHASLEAASQRYAQMLNDPLFKTEFADFSQDQKAQVIADIAKMGGTQAGKDLQEGILGDLERVGNQGASATNPYAKAIVDSRNWEKGAKDIVIGGVSNMLALGVLNARTQDAALNMMQGVGRSIYGNEAVDETMRLFRIMENADSAAYGPARDALTEHLNGLRKDGAAGAARGLLTGAMLAADVANLLTRPWGENVLTDGTALLNTAKDATESMTILAGALKNHVAWLGSKGATSTLGFLGARVVPGLGAIAGAFSMLDDYQRGQGGEFVGDLISTAGYATIALTAPTGVGPLVGGAAVAVGTGIKLGAMAWNWHQNEQAYRNYSEGMLEDVMGQGNPRIQELMGLDKGTVASLAAKHNKSPQETYDTIKASWERYRSAPYYLPYSYNEFMNRYGADVLENRPIPVPNPGPTVTQTPVPT